MIEREIEVPEYVDRAKILEQMLKERGHEVDFASELKSFRQLGKYDLAVGHPRLHDAAKLWVEVERRPDFRVLLCTPDKKFYISAENAQVCSLFPSSMQDYDNIVKLIEKGWVDECFK